MTATANADCDRAGRPAAHAAHRGGQRGLRPEHRADHGVDVHPRVPAAVRGHQHGRTGGRHGHHHGLEDRRCDPRPRDGQHHRHDPHPVGQAAAVHPVLGGARSRCSPGSSSPCPTPRNRCKLVYFGVCYVLWSLAYTVCDVPFWGLIGSAFTDPTERTRVIGMFGPSERSRSDSPRSGCRGWPAC